MDRSTTVGHRLSSSDKVRCLLYIENNLPGSGEKSPKVSIKLP